jgi:hypothetical protein
MKRKEINKILKEKLRGNFGSSQPPPKLLLAP